MANEIYSRTWWGDAYNTAESISKNPSVEEEDLLLFYSQFRLKERVIAESATMEGAYCIAQELHKIANT